MPTLRDVADAVGVSAATASRALADSSLVNAETRRRVRDAADSLGYRPNRAARSLITGRTGNIGLLVPDLTNPFFTVIAKGIQNQAQRRGMTVLIADSDEQPRAEADLIALLAQQVDGLVLCSPRSGGAQLTQACKGRATVVVNRRVRGLRWVCFDNADGVRQAEAHLVGLGHEAMAWLPGPESSRSSRERTVALRAGDQALEVRPLTPRAPSYEGGVAAVDEVLNAGVTSVLAFNDLMALGLLAGLTSAGFRVPDDISVVGFDNVAMSEMTHPALTTVALTKAEAGRVAVEMLDELLGGRPGRDVVLPVELAIRASTGPARRSRSKGAGRPAARHSSERSRPVATSASTTP